MWASTPSQATTSKEQNESSTLSFSLNHLLHLLITKQASVSHFLINKYNQNEVKGEAGETDSWYFPTKTQGPIASRFSISSKSQHAMPGTTPHTGDSLSAKPERLLPCGACRSAKLLVKKPLNPQMQTLPGRNQRAKEPRVTDGTSPPWKSRTGA